jgi:hypothetical protein
MDKTNDSINFSYICISAQVTFLIDCLRSCILPSFCSGAQGTHSGQCRVRAPFLVADDWYSQALRLFPKGSFIPSVPSATGHVMLTQGKILLPGFHSHITHGARGLFLLRRFSFYCLSFCVLPLCSLCVPPFIHTQSSKIVVLSLVPLREIAFWGSGTGIPICSSLLVFFFHSQWEDNSCK